MVIAQITDIHITPDRESVHGVDVVSNFRRVLASILAEDDVTHIALTGDLCFNDPLISIMEWVKGELDATGLPYFVIPGNHDDSIIMAQVFDLDHYLQGEELYYNVVIDGVNLIFLDSSKGSLSVDQASWLKAIDMVHPEPSIIFMHHPPVDAVPYMDASYALEEKPAVQLLLSGLDRVLAVFCGHYHVSKEVRKAGLPPVYITPSTYFQIDDSVDEFKVATHNIGWRRIRAPHQITGTEVVWIGQ